MLIRLIKKITKIDESVIRDILQDKPSEEDLLLSLRENIDTVANDEWLVDDINIQRAKAKSKLSWLRPFKLPRGGRYLDIGAANGVFTKIVGKYLGAKPFAYEPNRPDNVERGVTYVDLGGKYMVISAFMVLHHIEDVEATIAYISRMLLKSGVFIIREHNCCNPQIKNLTMIEHLLYDVTMKGDDYEEALEKNKMWCKPRRVWRQLIESAGLIYQGGSKEIGVTKYYFDTFRKK